MKEPSYFHPESDTQFSADDLRAADKEAQIEVMRAWFYKNYEDPAERTPYETAEGGYQWIWGGPYDVRDELQSEFSGLVSHETIMELVDELNQVSVEWSPAERPEDYDDYLFAIQSQQAQASESFHQAIESIRGLLAVQLPPGVYIAFRRLLFVNVIFALETYLSESFIAAVATDESLFRRYVETAPEFKQEKFTLSEVFKAQEVLEEKVKSTLVNMVWHKLSNVREMYKDALDIQFPKDIGELQRAILTRHDIVHRNGKTKDGEDVIISDSMIQGIIQCAIALVRDLDAQFIGKVERDQGRREE